MDLFSFYSREFVVGELVAVFKTREDLRGYGILLKKIYDDDFGVGHCGEMQMSNISQFYRKYMWLVLIDDRMLVINEFDMEKL